MTSARPYVVIIFHADGRITRTSQMKKPTYEQWTKAVGGYVQEVPHFTKYDNLTRGSAYANEDGIRLRLPFNRAASKAWLKNLGKGPFLYVPQLFGDIIFYAKESK